MITFADLQDEKVKKQKDDYLISHPDPGNNFYDLTAKRFISLCNQFGINDTTLAVLNRTDNPPHDLVLQYLITCLQMLVAQNLVGLGNDPIINDIWNYKYKIFRDDLKSIASQLSYEIIVSGTMQQNYTRAGGNSFRVMC
jgi:hypothetical protein